MLMVRMFRILLAALLLGPIAAEILLPSVVSCAETGDCCAPDGACDHSGVVCPCCAIPGPSVEPPFSAEAADVPAGPTGTTPGTAELPLLPTDILHVPKSL